MNRRAITAIAIGTAALAVGASPAWAGLGPVEWSIHVTASGPGTITAGSLSIRDASLLLTVGSYYETLAPTPDGNNAEFRGWAGECAPAGLAPCTVTEGGISMASMSLDPSRCRWTAALFALPDQPTPSVANPCETPSGGGGSGSGSGTGGSTGSTGGGAPGASAPLPAVGTGLQGGVTVVRKAASLKKTRTSAAAGRVGTTGRYPARATRVVQSLVLASQPGVAMAGTCKVARAQGTFTCTARPPKGRWRVITQAKRGDAVLAQSSAIVTVR